MKTRQLTLVEDPNGNFLVTAAQDTVEYLPGRTIHKDMVEHLCRNNSWKIKIIRAKEERT